MASETYQRFKDLSWFLQAIKDPDQTYFNLQTLSFSSSGKTTHCHLVTDNSMNINVTKDNITSLSQIFIELATSLETQKSLRNLEFEGIVWEIEILQSLALFLDNTSQIKQLTFRKNRFSELFLNELSEILKRNSSVKEIMFLESRIGYIGATLIGSALEFNDSLEELQIWEDSIGVKGAEALSKMIETNSSLKLLSIFDFNPFTATPLISAVLGKNRETEVHVWCGDHKRDKTSKLVEFFPESNTLRIYQIDIIGSCRVTAALGMNTTVRSLDMTGTNLNSRWAKEFRWVLEQNKTLREVKLSKSGLKDKAIVYIAAGLFKNKTLQSLYVDGNRFGSVGVEDLLCPLSRFSALQLQANITLKTLVFGGAKTKIGRDGLSAILKMVTTNETVAHLGVHDDTSLGPDDFIHIFKSLQKNKSLRKVSLQGCKGVRGDRLLEAITETLQINPLIEEIDLARTPLQDSGKADEINQKLGHNGRNIDEVETDSLQDMPLTEPKSVRAFLCGQDSAGKTTLCNSILQNFSTYGFSYVENVRTLMNPVEQAVKTVSGMKIKTFKEQETKILMWNLAGQHEFYAVHDLMFPSPCLFLIILSLFKKPSNKESKTPGEVEEELQYWLRFIISNSRKAVQQCMKPNVTIVLTHCDKINQQTESFQTTVGFIQRLRDKFQALVDFYPTVFTVDARSSLSVSNLTHHIRMTSKAILQRVPRVYQLCNDMIQLLSHWRSENSNKPIMRWKAFADLCQFQVPSLRIKSRNENIEIVETRRRAIATCLHQIGEVIYFDELDFLILDYEWFCGEVLAQLIKLDARKQSNGERNGFVSRKELEKILKSNLQSPIPGMTSKVLEHFDVCDLVKVMKKIELCYEQDPSNPGSLLLVPSILEEGRGKAQKWQISTHDDYLYAGRHLECDDLSHMFLTAGFFPRLQVHLHNKIMELKNQHGATYSLEKFLIAITIHGINIRVELGGQFGNYIDVLACSTKSLTETLRLIHQLILPAIQNSCHGVILIEHIIRPQCVKDLTPPRFRKSQIVSLQRLKEALSSVPAETMYDYQHTWDSVLDSGKTVLRSGFDLARDLLSDDDFREVLQRRYHDLYNLAQELQVPTEENPDNHVPVTNELENVDPSFGGIAKGVEAVLQRLKIIEKEIRDLKQEIQGLRYYEHRLLIQLHHKVNYLVNYNVQMDERKVPNMFYFIRAENYGIRLITSMVPGMASLKIHMLCEFRREIHVVEDQIGCNVIQIDNQAVKCLAPYMTNFMKLVTFALRIGANWAAGMGHMIPDLGHVIAHLANPSVMTGAAGAAGAIGMAAALSKNRGRDRDLQEQDQRAAQQWLIDYLREQNCSTGRDIAEKFGLWRVRYRDDGSIAWICKRHMITRANEVIQVPL